MERCSPEWRRRPAAATARQRRQQPAAARSGGGPWGQRPLAPLLSWRWCCYGGGSPPQDGCLGGGKFVVPLDLGFLPLYIFSYSRHPLLGSTKTGISGASGLGLGRILCLDRAAENSLQLSRLDFFHLTSSSGPNVEIFENSFQTDFWKVPI